MRRRSFLLGAGAAVAWPRAGAAQSGRTYRVGVINKGTPMGDASPFGPPLIRGLARHGYRQGSNLVIELRAAEGQTERLPLLVDELMRSGIDVVIAFGHPTTLVVRQRATVPIVIVNAGDPVAGGLVDSLARPNSSLTGISDVSLELTPKRMAILREFAPALRRIAVLWNADDLGMTLRYQAAESGAAALGVSVQALALRDMRDFERAFAAMDRDRPDAILMVADALTSRNRKPVIDYASSRGLPAIYEHEYFVRDGGLVSYGPDLDEMFERVASLVDRILKGAKPSQLPFEQPTRFRMAINLKTAKALGMEIPASLIASADEVIE